MLGLEIGDCIHTLFGRLLKIRAIVGYIFDDCMAAGILGKIGGKRAEKPGREAKMTD